MSQKKLIIKVELQESNHIETSVHIEGFKSFEIVGILEKLKMDTAKTLFDDEPSVIKGFEEKEKQYGN